MSFNGSGTYVPPTGQPVTPGTVISSSVHNVLVTDIGNTFNNTLPRDGQAPMSAPLKVVDGTSSVPAIAFNSEPSTGLYRPAANTIALTAGGAEGLRLSGSGRVLLGTSTDNGADRLQVNGSALISSNASVGGNLVISGTSTFTGSSTFAGTATIAGATTITGNVGLGTTPATAKLDIAPAPGQNGIAVRVGSGAVANIELAGNGLGVGSGSLSLAQRSDGSGALVNRAGTSLVLGVSGTDYARMISNGNFQFGAGTPSDGGQVQLSRSNPAGGSILNFANRGTNASHTDMYDVGAVTASGYRDVQDPSYIAAVAFRRTATNGGLSSSGSILLKTDDIGSTYAGLTTRAVVNATGLGLSTEPSTKLHVAHPGSANTRGSIWFSDQANSTGYLGIRSDVRGGGVGFGSDGWLGFSTGQAGSNVWNERFSIDGAGVAYYGGIEVGYRSVPIVTGGPERGKCFSMTSGGVTFGIESPGNCYTVYNNSASAQPIAGNGTITVRLAGTTATGNRSLAPRGIATVLFVANNEIVVSGAGVS